MRFVVTASVLIVAAAGLSSEAAAQAPAVSHWNPPISLGYYRVIGNGESSHRVGVAWYPSAPYEVLATTSFWENYDVVEAEFRVLWSSRSTLRPFLSVSGLWQNHSGDSMGGTLGGGVEYDWAKHIVLSGTLAWQSLFALDGQSGNHWFRVSLGVVVPVGVIVPFGGYDRAAGL